jgi:uncharacterized protein involved in exopolysaccharide biosynthesis
LYRRRWWIVAVTVLIAVASVFVSLRLPVWYASSVQLLIPESSGGALGALLGDVSPLAKGVLGGGGGGDYTRYLALLKSRPMAEAAVDRFDLTRVYDLEEARYPREQAITQFSENVTFEVDLELDFLVIQVLDRDPRRAAQIATFLTDELNRQNAALSTQSATSFRGYIQGRYERATAQLDSARVALQAFQERNGVVELPSMAQAFVGAVATQRAEVARIELQYRALLSQYGEENPDVIAAKAAYDAAVEDQDALLEGRDRSIPLSYSQLPSLGNRYATLYQDVMMQGQIIESILPVLEQARYDEARERVAVQVISPATPAVHKAKPKRSQIVIASTVSGFLTICVLVVLLDRVKRLRFHERIRSV